MPVLELKNVNKSYKQGKEELKILNDTNFEINTSEISALIGPSGCGKSTLLQCAGLLDSIDSGQILIDGEDLSKANDNKRTNIRLRKMGFIYQKHHLLPEFTALENVMMPLLIKGNKDVNKAKSLLDQLGLKDRFNHLPGQLSGGEQQRVSIARAIINNPSIILADEPTGNLDPKTSEVIFNKLVEITRLHKIATLIVTHNYKMSSQMDKVFELKNGKIEKASSK